ncbi:MaoC family dehydratase [Saccharospirillum sp.]|uniref:MaoC family dehydratase n=1 Tax=Saccharospirillum sp. TaxID=2033801 RepID=UPI0034A064CD
MSVIDLIKEKKERLSQNQAEFRELIAPQWREYWNELWQSARNHEWVNWVLDQDRKPVDSPQDALTECDNPRAEAMRQTLLSQLGDVVYEGQWLTLEQDRINAFAGVTEDQQWIHTDPARAEQESPFRATIAHGFLTLSMIPKLTDSVDPTKPPYPGAKMVVNLGLNKVRFPYPLKAGSRVRATKKIVAVEVVRRGLEVTEEVTVNIEHTRRPACVAETVIRLVY